MMTQEAIDQQQVTNYCPTSSPTTYTAKGLAIRSDIVMCTYSDC